jgi:ankyrin repeat protein
MKLSASAGKQICLTIISLMAFSVTLPGMAMQPPPSDIFDAIKDNRTALALELLGKGSDVQPVDKEGMSALMWAVVMQNFEVIKALLARHANVNLKSSYGQTALMFCAIQHKTDTKFMTALLDAKANIHIRDSSGQTALFYTVQYEHPELTNLLLDKGADINTRDDEEYTVLARYL